MLNIKSYIKENISILIVLICFFFIAIFNAFMNIGIMEDGCHHFWEALTAENIWTGHEGFNTFPYNSRYFPSLIQHLSVGVLVLLGVTNIKILLFIFTLISYLLPIIILLIVYLNIPKEKRDCFEIILLYFLTCMNFLIYQVWTENLNTGLFLWVIFVIYYYNDFDKLSKFNLVSLILFSICSISSHPMTAVFVLPLIVFAIIKQYKTRNVPNSVNIVLLLSYIVLFSAFFLNVYYILMPISPTDDYLLFKIFKRLPFQCFFISTLLILITSLIKINNRTIKILFNIFYCFISLFLLYFILLKINSFDGFFYRVLGFYVPLFLMIFIFLKDLFKLTMNYNGIKMINFILIFVFLVHSICYGILWNRYLIDLKNTVPNKTMNFVEVMKFDIFHYYTLLYDLVFIQPLFNVEPNYKIVRYERDFVYDHVGKIRKKEKTVSKFNIDVNVFITE